MKDNCIIIAGIKYNLIPDKEGKDNCYKCDLKKICEEKLDINSHSYLCNIFFNEEILNGYFKINEQ